VLEEEEASVDSANDENEINQLEQKMENLMWKMKIFIVCVACVVFGIVWCYSSNVTLEKVRGLRCAGALR
jgi:hypothetical protein